MIYQRDRLPDLELEARIFVNDLVDLARDRVAGWSPRPMPGWFRQHMTSCAHCGVSVYRCRCPRRRRRSSSRKATP